MKMIAVVMVFFCRHVEYDDSDGDDDCIDVFVDDAGGGGGDDDYDDRDDGMTSEEDAVDPPSLQQRLQLHVVGLALSLQSSCLAVRSCFQEKPVFLIEGFGA